MDKRLMDVLVQLVKTADDPYAAVDKELTERIETVAEWSLMSESERKKFVELLMRRCYDREA